MLTPKAPTVDLETICLAKALLRMAAELERLDREEQATFAAASMDAAAPRVNPEGSTNATII